MSDALYWPVDVAESRGGVGRGRGMENRREDCSRRAGGELSDLDMADDYVVPSPSASPCSS